MRFCYLIGWGPDNSWLRKQVRILGTRYLAINLTDYAGYPIICIPIGVDSAGIPFSLSIQHTAWKEDVLIKWASAIEDLVLSFSGGRVTPTYRNHLSKNLPIAENDTG